MSGLAVSQPVLDVFADGVDVFVFRRAGRFDIVAFALVVALGPALVLWAVGRLVRAADGRVGRFIHAATVAALAASVAIQAGKRLTDLGWKRLGVAGVVVGVILAVAVTRWAIPRLFLRYLAVVSIAFPVLFLVASPVTSLVFADGDVTVENATVDRPAPVVVIVLDELPTKSLLDGTGRIDRELYPAFAALAEDATWYRNHTTVATYTPQAVPAILTGRWPVDHDKAATAAEYPRNLFSLLGGTYDLNVTESFTDLCPPKVCRDTGSTGQPLRPLLGQAADIWTDLASPKPTPTTVDTNLETGAVQRPEQLFEDLVSSLDGSQKPSLHFLHVLLPHEPWSRLPNGQRYEAPKPAEGLPKGFFASAEAASSARQRHLLQLQYTDAQVGRVMDRLRAVGRYEDSLIVVTADHGVAFLDQQPFRVLLKKTAPAIVWTPLFVKAPGQADGEIDDREVRSIDVLPTMADHLGIDLPWAVDGTSALAPRRRSGAALRVFRFTYTKSGKPSGSYTDVDAQAGLAEVLGSRAVAADTATELRLYRRGRFGDLVGTPVDELTRARPSDRRATIDARQSFDDVNPDADTIPVYVAGDIDAPGPVTVAVTVNGKVGGFSTTDLMSEGSARRRFWTMIPPALLEPGSNDLELFVVEGDPSSARLAPVSLDGEDDEDE